MCLVQMQPITSKENPKLKAAAKLLQSKKARQNAGEFLAEGYRLCADALRSGLVPRQVFVTQQTLQKYDCIELLEAAKETYLIEPSLAGRLSDTQTPQGIFCVFPILDNSDRLATIKKNRVVVLSSLQDPGNIGTIIRTAEAFGLDLIVMSSDCPDLYSPKTLRATMGGVFRMPILVTDDLTGEIGCLRNQVVAVYAAALHEQSTPITKVNFAHPSAIVIGNEGNGLTDEVIEACTQPVIIPMAGRAESLNAAVAATVAMWEMCRAN